MNFSAFNAGEIMLFLGIIIALLVLILHKVRRIHLATYELKRMTAESEVLFAQIQALIGLEKILELQRPLPPLRNWAASPDFLLRLAEELLDRRPTTVMECSSGVSTIVCARILQRNGFGHVFSLEHDPIYASKTRKTLADHGLQNWATLVDAPLTTDHTSTPWYSLDGVPTDLPPIDIVVVDGPPEKTARLARYPALPQLASRLAVEAIVMVDDANRPDEMTMLQKWKTEFPEFQQHDGFCEKGCVIVERSLAT